MQWCVRALLFILSVTLCYFMFIRFTKIDLKAKIDEPISEVVEIKTGNKWIVVTSVSAPTEDVKRLASFPDWNLVVVADTKTPLDWKLKNVHFLSVEYQKKLPFSMSSLLPYKSYTRKNIGYLYAISHGAEWIYDTDDDNKPFGQGLKQFNFEESVSGVRYQPNLMSSQEISQRLFNPYEFYGVDQMWPRGFPLEHIEKHKNRNDSQVLCYEMKRAAVQQGLVHHDPDVDAIYRLLHADSKNGLNLQFNKFAPPITLSVGSYSPWNSQNTLFHKSAFHTLFLPTTVSFRTTDIWRSFISQKILHLSGLTVSFVPTNAVQFRNAHNYLKDFKDEKQVYEDSGRMIDYLHNWKCSPENSKQIENCIKQLVNDLVKVKLWGEQDAVLTELFLADLKDMRFEFPSLVGDNFKEPYFPSTNEISRDVNCRRMQLSFELKDPRKTEKDENVQRAAQKINYFGDIAQWCNETGYSNLTGIFSSPEQLAREHDNSYVFKKDLNSVLIVVNNYPWKYGMGLLQRLYQPYFATTIFCGSWYPENFTEIDNFTTTLYPINYVHLNEAEIHQGYFGYHCLTVVKEMGLSNVEGYFLMADDAIFNIWQRIDYSRVFHLHGSYNTENEWHFRDHGGQRVVTILKAIKSTTDKKLLAAWDRFDKGLQKYGYYNETDNAEEQMKSPIGKSISDFYYIPTSESEYYAHLMRLFYDNQLFLEIAVNRFLRSVNHSTSLYAKTCYLWGNRAKWDTVYHKDMVAMHPVKISQFMKPGEARKRYCASILQTWSDIVFGGSQDFTVKSDNEVDYINGFPVR
ncbi:Exostosin domain-containing protein [Caenorhabditis elegans]|uniref:Exostosin domain-containing protein n=1 Tax=Caenorhabditis elegans TaxID=6239 RepID=Q9TXX9_CAEEL|nr:Exostosin domain-containing protein [Caenorhabditis elegans]CCD70109.1 Exostosin domain-containing protein [Caenorhabditis elegans]|eukprot:NP_493817.2 Uncharacterized protein CELE_F46F5.11 [Caenorhabditis elegans]